MNTTRTVALLGLMFVLGATGCTGTDLAALFSNSGRALNGNGNTSVVGGNGSNAPTGASDMILSARLTGDGPGHGEARWEVHPGRVEFEVEVESGMAGATLDVVVDGVSVDQLTLNAVGFGKIEYRDPPDDNPDAHEFPFPTNFPAVQEGTVVAVGNLSGTLTMAVGDAGMGGPTGDDSPPSVNPPGPAASPAKLVATLSGDGPGNGQAVWETRPDRVRFKVEVESGMPGSTLDITVDGVQVAQMTLNAAGFGELEYRDPPDNDPGPNEFPFPPGFPSVRDGTVVRVGNLSGTLHPVVAAGS